MRAKNSSRKGAKIAEKLFAIAILSNRPSGKGSDLTAALVAASTKREAIKAAKATHHQAYPRNASGRISIAEAPRPLIERLCFSGTIASAGCGKKGSKI